MIKLEINQLIKANKSNTRIKLTKPKQGQKHEIKRKRRRETYA